MAPLVPEIVTADTWRDILGGDDAAARRRHRPDLRPHRRRHRPLRPLDPRHGERHGGGRRHPGPGRPPGRRRPLGHSAGGRARLPRRRRADRRPERRLRHPLRHAGLHRHADDDDVLLRGRDLVRLGLHDLGQLDRQPAARASSASARAVVFGLPVSILVAGAVAVVGQVVLEHTLYGRWLFAIGLNPRAAAVSGVPVRKVVFWAYVISGAVRRPRLDPLHRPARDRLARAWASASCSTSSARR